MFFSISSLPAPNFSCHWKTNNNCISTDEGWASTVVDGHRVIYKGYAEDDSLENLLPQIIAQSEPKYLGNFCVMVSSPFGIQIKTDRYRSFPLWYGKGVVTNLTPLSSTVWSDRTVTVDNQLNITTQKFDVIGDICTTTLSEDEVVGRIDSILLNRVASFVKNNKLPIRVFHSGGVDTLLVYSYLRRLEAEFEVVDYSHFEYDRFYNHNSHHLEKFWAYNQLHHWRDNTVLASGAPGDEFMLRSPTTSDMYLKWHGTSVVEQLALNPNCLHAQFFARKVDGLTASIEPMDKHQLQWCMCNNVTNDYQHWHLGNTLTWTPLRDLEIFKTMLRLPLQSAIGQILDSRISKRLIENNVPGATKWLSDQKNAGPVRKNIPTTP